MPGVKLRLLKWLPVRNICCSNAIKKLTIYVIAVIISLPLASCTWSKTARPRPANIDAIAHEQFSRFHEILTAIKTKFVRPIDEPTLMAIARLALDREVVGQLNLPSSILARIVKSDTASVLEQDFVEAVRNRSTVNVEKVIDAAIVSFLHEVSPGSSYDRNKTIDKKQLAAEVGIGALIGTRNGKFVIVRAIPESPAELVGLLPGDQLISTDGKNTGTMTLTEAAHALKGVPGTEVELGISRAEVPLSFSPTRESVSFQSVDTTVIGNGLAYSQFNSFVRHTKDAFRTQLNLALQANGDGLNGLILDLRQNSGGELASIVEVADEFIGKGVVLVLKGRTPQNTLRFIASADVHPAIAKSALVVLVDGGTSAGSEALATLLRLDADATIVGNTSAGINVVKTVVPISSGGVLYLETGRLELSNDRQLPTFGIVPDICVATSSTKLLQQKNYDSRDTAVAACSSEMSLYGPDEEDKELAAAVSMLKEKIKYEFGKFTVKHECRLLRVIATPPGVYVVGREDRSYYSKFPGNAKDPAFRPSPYVRITGKPQGVVRSPCSHDNDQ